MSSALAVAVLVPGCHPSEPPPPAARVIAWKVAGAWSGTGNVQTMAFTSDTGAFRVRWEATNETVPGQGRLKVQFRSGDSGRVIMEPVDQHGVGSGSVETADQVLRWYYLTIEAEHLEWKVAVDEPVMGHTVPRTDRSGSSLEHRSWLGTVWAVMRPWTLRAAALSGSTARLPGGMVRLAERPSSDT